MEQLGTVVEILGKTLLLIKADKSLDVGDILTVFAQIETENLADKYQLPHIFVPKGEIRITAKQTPEYYLAETFRELTESTKIVDKPSSLLTGIWGSETVREKVLGPPSAALDPPSAPIQFSKQVAIGDRVGND